MRVHNGYTYKKPLASVHWRDWNGNGMLACGKPAHLPCDESLIEVTCRTCRRRIAMCFTLQSLDLPLSWLRGAWIGDEQQRALYAEWAVEHERSLLDV